MYVTCPLTRGAPTCLLEVGLVIVATARTDQRNRVTAIETDSGAVKTFGTAINARNIGIKVIIDQSGSATF